MIFELLFSLYVCQLLCFELFFVSNNESHPLSAMTLIKSLGTTSPYQLRKP